MTEIRTIVEPSNIDAYKSVARSGWLNVTVKVFVADEVLAATVGHGWWYTVERDRIKVSRYNDTTETYADIHRPELLAEALGVENPDAPATDPNYENALLEALYKWPVEEALDDYHVAAEIDRQLRDYAVQLAYDNHVLLSAICDFIAAETE